jgi:hypothetical protein
MILSNVYVFRISTGNEYKREELSAGILRQGWGVENLQLVEKDGTIVDENTWIERWPEYWGDDEKSKRGRYKILKPMLDMKEGDMVIIPKYPDWDTLTIAKIKEGYKYDLNEKEGDFGHKLKIDIDKARYFAYNANEHSKLIHSKMRSYQSAVNRVHVEKIKKAVMTLSEMESDKTIKDISKIVKSSFFENTKFLKDKLFDTRPNDIEKLTEEIFTKAGYTLISKNSYDREGGDADLIFQKNLDIISEFSSNDVDYRVYVQVKKKQGEVWNELEGIEQLIKITKGEKGNFSKVLVSTSEFSTHAQAKAREEDIVLIGGDSLIKLILKYL